MAKGVTNQPLVVWVAEQWYSHPEILKLMAAGHDVIRMDEAPTYTPFRGARIEPDLILHPAAHSWTDDMFDYLPAALTAARARRRKNKK